MNEKLLELRKTIDEMDENIFQALQRRFDVAREIGRLKEEIGMPIRDMKREEEMMAAYRERAKELGLDPTFIEELLTIILAASRREQE